MFRRAFVAELDIHFGLGQVGFFHARLDGVGDAFVVCRQLVRFLLLAGQRADEFGWLNVFGDRLRVVVQHHNRNARFVDAGEVWTQSLVLPVCQNQQIGFQCQYFFNGERADFHFAHVGKLVQLGHGFAECRPARRRPVGPNRFGEADHIIQRVLAADGHVILIIKAQNHAFGGQVDGYFAAVDIGNLNRFGMDGGSAECQCGGEGKGGEARKFH